MNGFPGFVHKDHPATLEQFLDHVDYIAKLVGTDHIGLGLDYSQSTPEDYKYWGYDPETYPMPPWKYPTGVPRGLPARKLHRRPQEARLLGRGRGQDVGLNFIRVFKAVWKA